MTYPGGADPYRYIAEEVVLPNPAGGLPMQVFPANNFPTLGTVYKKEASFKQQESYLYLNVNQLLGLYCADNNITLTTGPSGIPSDAEATRVELSPDGLTLRVAFITKKGKQGMHYRPEFDIAG